MAGLDAPYNGYDAGSIQNLTPYFEEDVRGLRTVNFLHRCRGDAGAERGGGGRQILAQIGFRQALPFQCGAEALTGAREALLNRMRAAVEGSG